MNQLMYFTRGNSSPSGKARVYLACHPSDCVLFSEQIADDILRLHNCVLWCAEDGSLNAEGDELADILLQMQLIVVPVTSRLLTERNHALEAEIPFAIANNIPVLPLMQEPGLDKLFYEKFGDMQYLDPNQHDATAISYSEKLERYLNSVLVGDELADRIRSAFDAYVFLSYRKKDRRQANELMRLIHSNEFCRDIAIWYDEYLVPGEGFNQAIADALNKCRLFAMVVTPNLVNEVNYVMTTEYPAAVAARKPVLPIEAVRTDRNALMLGFEGIGECVSSQDTHKLSERLRRIFGDIAREPAASDPMHDYFIGLAYLDGIDVEVNHARAFELIHSAADRLLPEAMRKLADMYYLGQGVQRDYEKSIIWRRNIIEALRYCDAPEQLMEAYMNCGLALREMGRMQEAAALFREMSDAAADVTDENGFLFWQAEADFMLSVILFDQGLVDEAEERCISAMRVYLTMPYSFECYLKTMTGSLMLGQVCTRQNKYDEAMQWYEDALGFFEVTELLAPDNNRRSEAKQNYSEIFLAMGKLELERERLDSAAELGCKGLAMLENLYHEYPRNGILISMMHMLTMLGDVAIQAGNLAGAKEYYDRAAAIADENDELKGSIQTRVYLGDMFYRLGHLNLQQGDAAGAKENLEYMIEITRPLLKRYQYLNLQHRFAFALRNLGDAEYKLGRPEAARAYYMEALDQFETASYGISAAHAVRDVINTYVRLGDIDFYSGRLDMAAEWFDKCISLANTAGEDIARHDMINLTLVPRERLARIRMDSGDISGARNGLAECVEDLRYVVELNGLALQRHNLSVDLMLLGDVENTLGNRVAALDDYIEAMKISLALTKETDVPEYKRDLSLAYEKLGATAFALGRYEDVPAYYARCRTIREQLAREYGTTQAYADLWSCYVSIGDVTFPQNQTETARTFYEKALDIAENHFAGLEAVQYRRNIALSYDRMGLIDHLVGNHRRAYTHLERAMEIYGRILAEDPQTSFLREATLCKLRMGSVLRALGRPREAMDLWRQTVDVFADLYNRRRTGEATQDLMNNLYALADVADVLRMKADAREYCRLYIQLARSTDAGRAMLEDGYELMRRIN